MFQSLVLISALLFTSATALAADFRPPRQTTNNTGPLNDFQTKLSPSYFADFEMSRRIINLTESNSATRSLVVGDHSAGFQVVDNFEISGGIGPAMSFWFNNGTGIRSNLQASVGLLPSKGRTVSTIRFAPNKEAISRLKRWVSAPTKASDLRGWTTGDSVTYSSEGGIEFSAAVTYGPAIAVLSVSATGDFTTYVEKIDDKNFLVDLSATKVKTASASAGLSVAALAASHAKSLTNGLSFMVDASTEQGAKAYEDLVRGNVLAVQELVKQGRMNSVRPWEKYRVPQVADYLSFSIGVPILLKMSWSRGKLYKYNDTTRLHDGTTVKTNYGIYVKESELKVIRKKKTKAGGFYGVAFDATNADGSKMSGKFGQYIYAYTSNKSDSDGLRSAVRSVIRRTGLRNTLNVNVPEGAKGANQLMLAVDITDEQTDRLMELAATSTEQKFVDTALRLHSDYFAKGDVDGLCRNETDQMEECIDGYAREAQSGAERMHEYLIVMGAEYRARRNAEFAAAFAKFGRGMIQNQFTFQTVFELAGGVSNIEYTIQGANVSRYHLSFSAPQGLKQIAQ